MQYKNIIFDLGNVLVKLNPEGCIGVKQANINPDETLFIDDLKENCEAAEKLGIHTFQNVKFDDWLSLRF